MYITFFSNFFHALMNSFSDYVQVYWTNLFRLIEHLLCTYPSTMGSYYVWMGILILHRCFHYVNIYETFIKLKLWLFLKYVNKYKCKLKENKNSPHCASNTWKIPWSNWLLFYMQESWYGKKLFLPFLFFSKSHFSPF